MKLQDGIEFDGKNTIEFQTAGAPHRANYSFYRGEHTTFYPTDDDFNGPEIINILSKGMPDKPIIDLDTNIVAFGSCFAEHIGAYLNESGFKVATKQDSIAHISRMGDGIVNTFAVLQQFQWAWQGISPKVELWHGYDAKALGYDEEIRLATRAMLDRTDVFIITLGLSEIWYDEPTGEVFWRAVPADKFDPARHKFRTATVQENTDNLRHMLALIREYRPDAKVVLTLSPIPLTATFRPMSAMVANGYSKASLRCAIEDVVGEGVYYFPAFEMVQSCFHHQYMEDRRHIHTHAIRFMMAMFTKYFCGKGPDLIEAFRKAQKKDRIVGTDGHWVFTRANLKYSQKPA